jgi:hypothetical protein
LYRSLCVKHIFLNGYPFSATTGGDYALSGTIGQPDVGEMSGGDYTVSGGFWGRFIPWLYELFLPLIMR